MDYRWNDQACPLTKELLQDFIVDDLRPLVGQVCGFHAWYLVSGRPADRGNQRSIIAVLLAIKETPSPDDLQRLDKFVTTALRCDGPGSKPTLLSEPMLLQDTIVEVCVSSSAQFTLFTRGTS